MSDPPAHVMGLDLSLTATGIARLRGETETLRLPAKLGDQRLTIIRERVAEHLVERPDLVVVEDLPTHAYAAGATGMVHGVVRELLVSGGHPFALVAPATLKKFATGRGNATKADMRVALLRRAGVDERDDNAVDAWWLWAAGMQHLGQPAVELPKEQVAALDKVVWPE